MSVPVLYHPAYKTYTFGPEHPFSPRRLEMLTALLEALGYPVGASSLQPATREDILMVHAERLVRRVEGCSVGEVAADAEHYGLGTADTPIFPGMDEATRWLVGGTLEAARMILRGEAQEVLQLGGGLHHAQYDRSSGFCVYNDLSVAIRHLTRSGLRVAYLDIDVHHGDGVQWIHYDEAEVLTLSFHESGRYLFPGTGAIHEIGKGAGLGRKLNVPLEPFTQDESYLEVFEAVLEPALAWFRPDVMVIQCGADAHFLDPLADLVLSTQAYQKLFLRMREYVREFSGGKAVYTLGGGYSLDATTRIWAMLYLLLQGHPLPDRLPEAWRQHWEGQLHRALTPTLHDALDAVPEIPRRPEIVRHNWGQVVRLLELVKPYWT